VSGPDDSYHGASDRSSASRGPVDDLTLLTPRPAAERRRIYEPPRETPVHATTDVLVVGGGPAGCAAALAARRLGAEVVLVERYNHLGGLATGGLVIWIDRMTDWSGRQVIAGFGSELLERLPPEAIAGAPEELWGSTDETAAQHWRERQGAFRGVVTWSPMIDPEWLKLASAELLADAGVRFLLHSWAVDAVRDGSRVDGVVFESKQGRRAILADVVIDATGDLDVCRRAGAAFESGAEGHESNIQHCLNTAWTWAGVDFSRWIEFKRTHPQAHRELMDRARESLGYVERPMVGWRDDVAVFMGPRLNGYSGLDVDGLTQVEFDSRRRMAAHLEYFRRHAPGFERAWVMLSAPQVGVRHTGRVVGRRTMSAEDWKQGVRHRDEIGVSPSPSQTFANVSVPYGSLLPADLRNVLVAGRHIASDSQTQAFMREIPQCWLTGQAAGAAAALSVARRVSPDSLDVFELQRELRRQGAYLQTAEPLAGRASGV
jgi:2-polyprenyl-6-methoxyphenol hydroxylase-like FAD-dependent oxidoreductase